MSICFNLSGGRRFLFIILGLLLSQLFGRGAGVTLITHGFNSDVDSWIIPMADKIPRYAAFRGTNFSCYEISITQNGQGQYVASQNFLGGVNPLLSDSGETFIKLDWSTLSGFGGPATTTIATAAASALLSTNLIPELGSRPLAELPLHLIGHSRGASVVTELARILGAQGVWVDHVTTLDPHPVSSFGDPTMKNYANILFADNYWQNMGDGLFVPNGQSISGAYNRFLINLNGGYSSSHSDVHLWYHGTVDLNAPITVDGATITSTERQNWWTTLEQRGTNAGFRYSLIGGGDRLSSVEPAGAGNGRIRDGFNNKVWDLGAGLAANRDGLPSNNGAWPNVIRLSVAGMNQFPIGQPLSLAFYDQFAASTSAVATVRFYLDKDLNPYDGNEIEIFQRTLSGTGTNNVRFSTLDISLDPTNTVPGTYSVFVRIDSGVRVRYLYAPQMLTLTPSQQQPRLAFARFEGGEFRCAVLGYAGQTILIQASTNMVQWSAVSTNVLAGDRFDFSDGQTATFPLRYYRAVLAP